MLSLSSDSGYRELGRYNATKFGAILNGTSPRSLSQIFEDPLYIAVNTGTLNELEFTLPNSILRIAKEIYQ